jgi:hypothetical protein
MRCGACCAIDAICPGQGALPIGHPASSHSHSSTCSRCPRCSPRRACRERSIAAGGALSWERDSRRGERDEGVGRRAWRNTAPPSTGAGTSAVIFTIPLWPVRPANEPGLHTPPSKPFQTLRVCKPWKSAGPFQPARGCTRGYPASPSPLLHRTGREGPQAPHPAVTLVTWNCCATPSSSSHSLQRVAHRGAAGVPSICTPSTVWTAPSIIASAATQRATRMAALHAPGTPRATRCSAASTIAFARPEVQTSVQHVWATVVCTLHSASRSVQKPIVCLSDALTRLRHARVLGRTLRGVAAAGRTSRTVWHPQIAHVPPFRLSGVVCAPAYLHACRDDCCCAHVGFDVLDAGGRFRSGELFDWLCRYEDLVGGLCDHGCSSPSDSCPRVYVRPSRSKPQTLTLKRHPGRRARRMVASGACAGPGAFQQFLMRRVGVMRGGLKKS